MFLNAAYVSNQRTLNVICKYERKSHFLKLTSIKSAVIATRLSTSRFDDHFFRTIRRHYRHHLCQKLLCYYTYSNIGSSSANVNPSIFEVMS